MPPDSEVPVYGGYLAPGPRIAAFGLEPGERERLQNAFRNVKLAVEVVALTTLPPDQPFDGAILRADDEAPPLLTALRARSRRMIIYLVGPLPAIAHLAHFGVNAALEAMTEAAISRAVEHTYLLLAGQLRRHTRVPLYVPVSIQAGAESFTAITEDLSGGGISVHSVPSSVITMGQAVTVRILLPGNEAMLIPGGIICRISGGRVGVQFERGPEQARLRKWVEDFLE
ncbi:MAG: PilZ domain-containing protein [Acidobacteriota bacterium]|nr:PilZ domain-containing protein [Acidobacteriota bacterium]